MSARVSSATTLPYVAAPPSDAAPDYPKPPYKHGSPCMSGVALDA